MSTTADLKPGHMFTSYSGPDYHSAKCECGYWLPWETRDVAHALHLLAVAWDEGQAAGLAEGNRMRALGESRPGLNPYRPRVTPAEPPS